MPNYTLSGQNPCIPQRISSGITESCHCIESDRFLQDSAVSKQYLARISKLSCQKHWTESRKVASKILRYT